MPRIFNKILNLRVSKGSQNIILKNYFTGILSTILATPCTAPFVGTAISIALTQNFVVTFFIFLSMALGKGLPYFIFIIYPNMINYLPKPGKWFFYLKYFFAFLLFLTILWLINIHFVSKDYLVTSESSWETFDREKVNKYLDNGESVFVDVTAKWCITCLVNKKLILDNQDVIDLFKNNKIRTLRADWTSRNNDILEYLKLYNRHGIPFNIFYTPENRQGIVFSEILSKANKRCY